MEKQVVEEMLPPLSCKKFRWWSDELEKDGLEKAVLEEEDDDKEVMNCCSSLRTHINRCLKMKEKKIQRKRSIVEIFAIAPQIQANCTQEDDEEILANVKKKKKNKKKSNEIVRNGSKNKGMVKKGKKEKIHKFKASMQLALVGKLKSSVKGKKKMISKSKSSSKCNVTKIILASKLTKQNQKPIRKSVQGILKNCGRVTGKRSAVGNMQSDDPKKRRQLVDKHVRFSGNDYILGQSSSSSFCDHVVVSSVNRELENADNLTPTDGTQMKENEALNERDGCIVPSTFWSLNRSCQDRGQGLSEESLTRDMQPPENIHPLSLDKPISSHNTSYPDISWVRNFFQECAIPIQKSVAVDSTMITASELSTLSVAKSRNADGKHPLLSQDVSQQFSSCDMQYPFLQLSPKDLMTRICSLVDPKQKKAVSREEKFVEDDFVGLPLNSQGELIKLHSSGRGGLNQLKQSMMTTAGNLPVKSFMHPESSSHHLDKGDGCSVETTLPKEKRDIPSRMSQPMHQLDLDLNKMSISSCACSHYSQPQNQIDKENSMLVEKSDFGVFSPTRPTMRLMGKDVTVGKNNKEVQGSEEDKVWTDKNVINEQRRDAFVVNSSLSRNFETINTSSGKWKEPRIQPLGPPGVPTRPYIPQMNAVDPRSSHTYHDWSASMMPQSRPHLTMENQSVQMLPFTCSVPSKELMSGNLRMPADSPNLGSHMRSFTYSQYPCQCTRPNSTQLLYDQGLAHGSSGFRFPFVSPPCGECPQQSQPQSSSKTLPHWMLNVSQQKGSQFVPSEYATRAQNHPYSTPGFNYSSVSSHDFTSMISQPLRHAKPNLSDTYWVQRPLIPDPSGCRPNSSINASYGNRFYPKNKPKPHTVRCKDLERAKRTKKRPTDKIDDSIKHPTNPFLVVPAETSELIGMGNGLNLKLNPSLIHKQGAPRHDADTDNQIEVEPSVRSSIQNTRASVLDAYMDHGRYAEHSSSAVVNNSSMDTVARSGPTKLSAGAKHILKPSPNPDQDNSRLIHSTIPIGLVNNSGKVSELQKKPSKIYKL